MINGYTSLNLTKLDVLNDFAEIKIGVQYKTRKGDLLKSFPSDLALLGEVEVVYETVPGWQCDISACRSWESLPNRAQLYVRKIEELSQVKVRWIGVGASRDAMIKVP
jgi:adenylosuccinate synthase